MKKIISLTVSFFLLAALSYSDSKRVTFNAQAAWEYIKDLASDSMEGRRSGQPGGSKSEEYIASRFKEWGLEPAGDNGTYFQNFTMEFFNVFEGVVLEILANNARRNFYYGEDWRVQKYSGSGHLTAEIVFVGYGIHAPEKGYDDFEGVDVKGKLVLFSEGTPRKLREKLNEEAKMERRIQAAQKLEALGAMVFRSTSTPSRYFRLRLRKEVYKKDFVIISVENKVTDFIFKDLETEIRYLFKEIDSRSIPQSMETNSKAFISIRTSFDEKIPARNVLAQISGMDRNLKNEYIIIGAHMDHVGVNPMGEVMNGANDNASGTSVVMEIARVMKQNNVRNKRTVVFALWAGEEQGLLGSKYYVEHPFYPLEKTVVYINLDMVGHGNGKVPFQGIYYGPDIWNLLEKKLNKNILDYVMPGRGGPGGSDHTSFLTKGVPGFFVMTEGYHFKYHHSRDDFDLIRPELLEKTGSFIYQAAGILASAPGDFIPPLRRETYYLKLRTLINFKLSPLSKVIEQHSNAKDFDVDLQLSIIDGEKGLAGDELRISLINNLLAASEKIGKMKGLSLYSDSSKLSSDIRRGKTTVVVGIRSFSPLLDKPEWAEVLARQGITFVIMDNSSFLYDKEGLSVKGKKIIKEVNESGLLLLVKGADENQAKILLENSKKPLVLLWRGLPGKEVIELIKNKESAVGLILSGEDEASAYFRKLDEARKEIGSEHLIIVNEECLWGNKGRLQMLQVISEILKAEYEREDFKNIFSETFLRVLRKSRGEGPPRPYAYIPF